VQNPEPLSPKFHARIGDSGDIGVRPVEAGDEADLHRVSGGFEDDRNSGARCLCREGRGEVGGGDDGDWTVDQIGYQSRQAGRFIVRPAVFDRHVAPLDVAGFAQPFAECRQSAGVPLWGGNVEIPNHRHRRRLRLRRERPCRCAAEECDELAPFHFGVSQTLRGVDA
jgi:hypothetical protein